MEFEQDFERIISDGTVRTIVTEMLNLALVEGDEHAEVQPDPNGTEEPDEELLAQIQDYVWEEEFNLVTHPEHLDTVHAIIKHLYGFAHHRKYPNE